MIKSDIVETVRSLLNGGINWPVCVCVCVCVYWRGVSYLGHSVKKSAIKFELKTDRPSRGRSLTLDVLWIGPLGLRIGQTVCYLHAGADSSAPKSARTVISTAQWERGSGRTGHPLGPGGQWGWDCPAGLMCCPSRRFVSFLSWSTLNKIIVYILCIVTYCKNITINYTAEFIIIYVVKVL